MLADDAKTLSLDFFYIHAVKLKTVRFQCSHCGRFVGQYATFCEGCGADLR